jgi:hypothetical protein
MKIALLLLILLASCRAAQPAQKPYVLSPLETEQQAAIHQVFDGHPPVAVMDLEAAPDSIATVVAERYFLTRKQARKAQRHAPTP